MNDFVPIAKAQLTEDEVSEVAAVLRSGWLTTGPRTREFEERCRIYLGCQHAIAVSSGTAALHLALSSLNVGPGDEVITTPLTFAATVNAILYVGATPVLADVDPLTLNLSPMDVASKVTSRTRAILVVHYGGAAANMRAIEELAGKNGLVVVEDAAHAMGASYQGQRIGSSSRAACFSFHPVKNMTTGEGGLLATCEDEIERIARLRSWHGIDKNALKRYEAGGSWYYEVQELGFKYNLTDIQAAIGIHQLDRLDAANTERRAIAAEYDAAFRDLPGVQVAAVRQEAQDARHLYWMVLDARCYDRDRFISSLAARGIGTSVHYIPIHLHPYYQRRFGWGVGLCPVAERIYQGLVSIPLFHGMTWKHRQRVVQAVPAALQEARTDHQHLART
jgi:dTDP-4-amino-4,6-dideoxygalactose transaminase